MKRGSRTAAHVGVVLQRFEFIKVCIGKNGYRHYGQNFNIFFFNKKYLRQCFIFFSIVISLLSSIRSYNPSNLFALALLVPRSALRKKILKDNKHDSLHLRRKYARIFVLGHHLFLGAYSFPRATLSAGGAGSPSHDTARQSSGEFSQM